DQACIENDETGPGYYEQVAESFRLFEGDSDAVQNWAEASGTDVASHIRTVFEAAAYTDPSTRAAMVERGIQMQQQLLKEKRVKKSEKLVRAASKALEIARADSGYSTAKALADAAFLEVAALRTKWTVVQEFGTKEDALRFVLECQPFDYRPAGDAYDDFPRFQNSKDCLAYVMALEPFPSEFQSCEPVFKRRLRLQLAKEGEQKPDSAQRKTKPRPRTVMGQPSSDGARWQVQAAGCLFETPGLRTLAEKPPAQRLPAHRVDRFSS
ncbi:unnamed protein product, partial [Symbiodinium necroappetens]